MRKNKSDNRSDRITEDQYTKPHSAWIDSFPESVFIMNPEGIILDANDAFSSRFQRRPQECISANIYEILSPEIAALRRKKAEEVIHTARKLCWEDERNGRILRNTVYPTLSSEGKVEQLLIIAQDVTDLKLSELTTNNEQAISKTIIDTIPGAFYILDAKCRYVGWNTYQREKIVGKTEREMGSVNAIDTIHPDDRQLVSDKILNVFTFGTEEVIEGRVLLRGGPEFRWFLMTGKRLIIDNNSFLIGMGIDITERKQTEESLQQNEERFRKLFESHSAIQIILDPDTGHIIDANQAAEEFYGWSIAKLKQMYIHEINTLSPEEVKLVLKKWTTSQQLNFSFRHLRANGSIRDVEIFANKVEIKGKALVYCIIHDINQRKHFEALSAFRLRLLEMSSTDSVEALLRKTIDEAERMTASSTSFCHFFGNSHPYSSIQVVSSSMQKRVNKTKAPGTAHPSMNDARFWVDAIRDKRAVINNHYNSTEHQQIQPNDHPGVMRTLLVPLLHGEKVIAILGVVNKLSDYDEDDVHWVSMLANIAWDIVAKKIANEELEKLQCQLQHFQKMEMVGQLAGGIAHDFNNMLAVILGHTEMTMELVDPGQSIYANLEIIHKAASHSADLTHQLLAFARKQHVIAKVLNINSIIEEMLPILRRLVGENITLVWMPEKRLMQVKIDLAQINQILTNLCINARDAITGIGNITIETALVNIGTIDGTATNPATAMNHAILSISDNGCGIKKRDLPHIYEPFFTTKEVGKGTGMGLATVYSIVKQNNGSIVCESKTKKGTSFIITFPLVNEDAVTTKNKLPPEPEINQSTATILLVEDEPDILKLCKHMLEGRGYKVLITSTPNEAIRISDRYKGSINLLLTDVIMPDMNGNELSKTLQSRRPNIKTLFMSGYTSDIFLDDEMPGHVANFIQKPFSIKTLIKAVHKSLNL